MWAGKELLAIYLCAQLCATVTCDRLSRSSMLQSCVYANTLTFLFASTRQCGSFVLG